MPSMGEVVRMRRKMSWERFIEGIFEEEERREEGVEVEGLLSNSDIFDKSSALGSGLRVKKVGGGGSIGELDVTCIGKINKIRVNT